jgi:hypothetical protein
MFMLYDSSKPAKYFLVKKFPHFFTMAKNYMPWYPVKSEVSTSQGYPGHWGQMVN